MAWETHNLQSVIDKSNPTEVLGNIGDQIAFLGTVKGNPVYFAKPRGDENGIVKPQDIIAQLGTIFYDTNDRIGEIPVPRKIISLNDLRGMTQGAESNTRELISTLMEYNQRINQRYLPLADQNRGPILLEPVFAISQEFHKPPRELETWRDLMEDIGISPRISFPIIDTNVNLAALTPREIIGIMKVDTTSDDEG